MYFDISVGILLQILSTAAPAYNGSNTTQGVDAPWVNATLPVESSYVDKDERQVCTEC